MAGHVPAPLPQDDPWCDLQ